MKYLLIRIKSILPRNRFFRNVIVLMGGATFAQGIIVLVSPLLSRIYEPQDFGTLGIYISILSILTVIASLRYELAIPVAECDETAINLLGLSFIILFAMTFLCGIGLWLLGDDIGRWTRAPYLSTYLCLLPIGLFGAGGYQILNYWAVRKKNFIPLSKTRTVQSLCQVLVQISLGLKFGGPMGLLTGDVTGRSVAVGALGKMLSMRQVLRHLSFPSILHCAFEFRRFPKIMTFAAFFNALALQVPFIVLPNLFGPAIAGLYFFAHRILILPASLINKAVSQVFYGEAISLKTNPSALRSLSYRLVMSLFAIYLPLYGGFVLVGSNIFHLVFGQVWGESGVYAQIMSPMVLLWSIANPLSSLLLVGNRLSESLLFTVFELTIKIICLVAGAWMNSIYFIVVAFSLSGSTLCLVSIWRFIRVAKVKFRNLCRGSGIIFLYNLPFFIVLYACSVLGFNVLSVVCYTVFIPFGIFLSIRYLPKDGSD